MVAAKKAFRFAASGIALVLFACLPARERRLQINVRPNVRVYAKPDFTSEYFYLHNGDFVEVRGRNRKRAKERGLTGTWVRIRALHRRRFFRRRTGWILERFLSTPEADFWYQKKKTYGPERKSQGLLQHVFRSGHKRVCRTYSRENFTASFQSACIGRCSNIALLPDGNIEFDLEQHGRWQKKDDLIELRFAPALPARTLCATLEKANDRNCQTRLPSLKRISLRLGKYENTIASTGIAVAGAGQSNATVCLHPYAKPAKTRVILYDRKGKIKREYLTSEAVGRHLIPGEYLSSARNRKETSPDLEATHIGFGLTMHWEKKALHFMDPHFDWTILNGKLVSSSNFHHMNAAVSWGKNRATFLLQGQLMPHDKERIVYRGRIIRRGEKYTFHYCQSEGVDDSEPTADCLGKNWKKNANRWSVDRSGEIAIMRIYKKNPIDHP